MSLETDRLRPWFVSNARAREFEQLVGILRQSITNCGQEHGRAVARGYELDFGHDADALFRVANAEVQL